MNTRLIRTAMSCGVGHTVAVGQIAADLAAIKAVDRTHDATYAAKVAEWVEDVYEVWALMDESQTLAHAFLARAAEWRRRPGTTVVYVSDVIGSVRWICPQTHLLEEELEFLRIHSAWQRLAPDALTIPAGEK